MKKIEKENTVGSIVDRVLKNFNDRREDLIWSLDIAITKETIKSLQPTISEVKINFLDVEEALGKYAIVAINTKIKKDKNKKVVKKRIVKDFIVEGWYRLNDEKDYEILRIKCVDLKKAIKIFKKEYRSTTFYKIIAEEIL